MRRKSVVERAVWKLSPGGPTTGSGKQVGTWKSEGASVHCTLVSGAALRDCGGGAAVLAVAGRRAAGERAAEHGTE